MSVVHIWLFVRLWLSVSDSIVHSDQTTATSEKCLLEEEQRRLSRERKAKMEEWRPRLFERNHITGDWVYKYAEWVTADVLLFDHLW